MIDRRGFLAIAARAAAMGGLGMASGAAWAGQPAGSGDAWRFDFAGVEGEDLKLAAYRGEVLLVVNTASQCGFTPQYKGLQALWQNYHARGLVVIGVPSNDFGGQEPGSNAEILGFCGGTFGVTFPLAAKTTVVGAGAHPFYRWASAALGVAHEPRWNFHKYLINRAGRPIAAFASHVTPDDPSLVQAIEAALAETVTG